MKSSKYCLIDWLGALHDSHKGSIVWLGGEAKGISEILDTAVDELNTMAEQLIRNPVKHGYWVFDERWWYPPKCSVCNGSPDTPGFLGKEDFYYTKFCFCPNCGSSMDKEVNDG